MNSVEGTSSLDPSNSSGLFSFLCAFVLVLIKTVNLSRVALQLVYHSLQLVAFAVLAVLIMRLKLFLTPHMCIMASLICSKQVCLSLRVK